MTKARFYIEDIPNQEYPERINHTDGNDSTKTTVGPEQSHLRRVQCFDLSLFRLAQRRCPIE